MSKKSKLIMLAQDSMLTQAAALNKIASNLGDEFDLAIDLILSCKGRVVLCGMGKSGLVGQKIAATLASTGTTSFFMHPAEAFHGDLGMLTEDDLLILISYSGETDEVIKLIPSLKKGNNKIIAIVGENESTLGQYADAILNIKVDREVCPNNLAPTTSTLTTMAMGDALAVVLIKERNFKASDFAKFHPGGSLGKQLLTKIKDVMHQNNLPVISLDTGLKDAIYAMSEGRLGLVVILEDDKVKGIITDGDIRRALNKEIHIDQLQIKDVMTQSPKTVSGEMMLAEAEKIMIENKIKALIVTDKKQKLVGIIDIFN